MRTRPAWSAVGLSLVLMAGAADAAPTCLDRGGVTVRCGAPGAMPVGWEPQAGATAPDPPGPGGLELAGLAAVLGGLFALIALMPEFDGWEREREEE